MPGSRPSRTAESGSSRAKELERFVSEQRAIGSRDAPEARREIERQNFAGRPARHERVRGKKTQIVHEESGKVFNQTIVSDHSPDFMKSYFESNREFIEDKYRYVQKKKTSGRMSTSTRSSDKAHDPSFALKGSSREQYPGDYTGKRVNIVNLDNGQVYNESVLSPAAPDFMKSPFESNRNYFEGHGIAQQLKARILELESGRLVAAAGLAASELAAIATHTEGAGGRRRGKAAVGDQRQASTDIFTDTNSTGLGAASPKVSQTITGEAKRLFVTPRSIDAPDWMRKREEEKRAHASKVQQEAVTPGVPAGVPRYAYISGSTASGSRGLSSCASADGPPGRCAGGRSARGPANAGAWTQRSASDASFAAGSPYVRVAGGGGGAGSQAGGSVCSQPRRYNPFNPPSRR